MQKQMHALPVQLHKLPALPAQLQKLQPAEWGSHYPKGPHFSGGYVESRASASTCKPVDATAGEPSIAPAIHHLRHPPSRGTSAPSVGRGDGGNAPWRADDGRTAGSATTWSSGLPQWKRETEKRALEGSTFVEDSEDLNPKVEEE